jgi:hypothetical protein
MERGFIEGRYLGWATSKRGGGLRAALEGIGAELLDRRKWPGRVEAARCRKCGIDRWYENK